MEHVTDIFSGIDPKNVSFIFAGVWTILTDQPLEKCSLHYLLETCKNVSYMFSTVSSPKCKLHFRRSPPSKGVGIIVQSSADAEGRLFRIPGTYRCWKVRIFGQVIFEDAQAKSVEHWGIWKDFWTILEGAGCGWWEIWYTQQGSGTAVVVGKGFGEFEKFRRSQGFQKAVELFRRFCSNCIGSFMPEALANGMPPDCWG